MAPVMSLAVMSLEAIPPAATRLRPILAMPAATPQVATALVAM
jgi:hypothetical protein